MTKRHLSLMSTLRRTAAAVLLVAFCAPPSVSQERETRAHHKGDLRMHGHWKFVISNPDGTVAQTKEYENSLVWPTGVVAVLAGYMVPAQYHISANGYDSGFGSDVVEDVLRPAMTTCPANDQQGLIVRRYTCNMTTAVTSQTIVLAGSVTTATDRSYQAFWTELDYCSTQTSAYENPTQFSNTRPSACAAGQPAAGETYHTQVLTKFSIPGGAAIRVAAGQTFNVTVTLSMS